MIKIFFKNFFLNNALKMPNIFYKVYDGVCLQCLPSRQINIFSLGKFFVGHNTVKNLKVEIVKPCTNFHMTNSSSVYFKFIKFIRRQVTQPVVKSHRNNTEKRKNSLNELDHSYCSCFL